MAMFELQGPDGATYQIDAPDERSALGAFQRMSATPYQPGNIEFKEGDARPGVQGYSRDIAPAEFAADDAAIAQKRMEAAKPTLPERFMRGADDVMRSLASGATFGLADEMVAGGKSLFGGKPYGENLAEERARDAEIPSYIKIPGEIAGGVATGGGLARGGLTLLNAAKPTVGSMMGRGAAEGAAYGAAHGFGHGEGATDRFARAGEGAVLGAVTGGATGLVGGKMAQSNARKAIPSVDALQKEGKAAYDAAHAAKLVISPASFDAAVTKIADKAAVKGIDPTLHPLATAALKRLVDARGTPLTLEQADTLRQVLKDAASSNSKGERRIARIMVGKLDEYMNGLTAKDVIVGDPLRGVGALNKARDLWARKSKGEVIEALMERARDRAGQYSQSGYENALRTEFRQLAMNEKRLRGFTPEERASIKLVSRGGTMENILRLLGKMAPRGVVSGGFHVGVGSVFGPVAGAATMVAGEAAKRGATALTRRNAQAASDLTRSGGSMPPPSLTPGQLGLLQGLLVGGSEEMPGLMQHLPMGLLNMGR